MARSIAEKHCSIECEFIVIAYNDIPENPPVSAMERVNISWLLMH
jgi:hypothetical protein